MPSGGHARSGPAPKPGSGRSDSRGINFRTLPAHGYQGEIPKFPGPRPRARVVAWWEWAWRTPQAALWATDEWAWVIPAVADWARLKAVCETAQATGAMWTALRQREGDILLTADALARAGWIVAPAKSAEKAEDKSGGYDPRAEMGADDGRAE